MQHPGLDGKSIYLGCLQELTIFKINRVVSKSVTGELVVVAELSNYQSPNIPEQFLVVQA